MALKVAQRRAKKKRLDTLMSGKLIGLSLHRPDKELDSRRCYHLAEIGKRLYSCLGDEDAGRGPSTDKVRYFCRQTCRWIQRVCSRTMNTSAFTIPSRKAIPGPELSLLQEALKSGLPIGKGEATYFHEPRLPTGFPDLVAVYSRQSTVTLTPSRQKLDVCHLRILFHIHSVGTTSLEGLVNALMWKSEYMSSYLHDLNESNLVHIRGKNIRPKALRGAFAVSKIVAVEAKIDHWREALAQAVANTWFASHSYILLPKGQGAIRAASAATQFGVGVLIFDGVKTKPLVHSSRFQIPASYGSWLVNEWAIRRWFFGETNDRPRGSPSGFSRGIEHSTAD